MNYWNLLKKKGYTMRKLWKVFYKNDGSIEEDIIEYLEKESNALAVRDIKKRVNANYSVVTQLLKKLREKGIVEVVPGTKPFLYKIKKGKISRKKNI
jgi:Mn-dependent DtxR family transcriptional regulator